MKTRIPVFGILIILIGISFTPLNQGMTIREFYHPIASRDILYVGGSGEGNYTSIQDAIDNASDGDTVFVYDDSSPYEENIDVDKSINLIGEDKDTTIIEYSSVHVNARDVYIENFSIINGDEMLVIIGDVNCTFYNNNVISTSDNLVLGLWIHLSLDCKIIKNNISAGGFSCIHVAESRNIIIKDNYIGKDTNLHWMKKGIVEWDNVNITISRNHITKCTWGLKINSKEKIKVIQNNFIRNIRNAFQSHISFNVLWDGNYWGRTRILPKLIHGYYYSPWTNTDWHPASEPYDIL